MPSSSDYTNLRRLKHMHHPDNKEADYICNGGGESYSNTNSFSNISVSDDIIVGGHIYFNKSNNINGNGNKSNSINGENIILNGEIEVNGNIAINSKLAVQGDVSLNSKLAVANDVSLNSKLAVVGDVSLNSKLFIGDDVSLNSKLAVVGDVSFNSKLFIGSDVSINANLDILNDLTVENRLFVINDVSLGANLYVYSRSTFDDAATFNGAIEVNGNMTINSKLALANDVSLNSKLAVVGDVSLNSKLFIGSDVSINANLDILNDLTVENRLFVINDASLGANLYVYSRSTFDDDATFNGFMYCNGTVLPAPQIEFNVTGSITDANSFVINFNEDTDMTQIEQFAMLLSDNLELGTEITSVDVENFSCTINKLPLSTGTDLTFIVITSFTNIGAPDRRFNYIFCQRLKVFEGTVYFSVMDAAGKSFDTASISYNRNDVELILNNELEGDEYKSGIILVSYNNSLTVGKKQKEIKNDLQGNKYVLDVSGKAYFNDDVIFDNFIRTNSDILPKELIEFNATGFITNKASNVITFNNNTDMSKINIFSAIIGNSLQLGTEIISVNRSNYTCVINKLPLLTGVNLLFKIISSNTNVGSKNERFNYVFCKKLNVFESGINFSILDLSGNTKDSAGLSYDNNLLDLTLTNELEVDNKYKSGKVLVSYNDTLVVGKNIKKIKNAENGKSYNLDVSGNVNVDGNITLSGNIISNEIGALNKTIFDLSNQVNLLGNLVTCILYNRFPHGYNHHHHKKHHHRRKKCNDDNSSDSSVDKQCKPQRKEKCEDESSDNSSHSSVNKHCKTNEHHSDKSCDKSSDENSDKSSDENSDESRDESSDENSDENSKQWFDIEYFKNIINKNGMTGYHIDKLKNNQHENIEGLQDFSTLSEEGLSNILYRNQKMFPAQNILSSYEKPSCGIIDFNNMQGLSNMMYGGYPKMLYAPNIITYKKSRKCNKNKCVKKHKHISESEDSDESENECSNHCHKSKCKGKKSGKCKIKEYESCSDDETEQQCEKYSGKTEKPIKINILGESTTIKIDCGLSYKCGDMITCVSIANPNDFFQGYVQYYDSSNGFMAISQIKFINGNIGKIEDIYSISLLTKRPDLDINITRLNEIYGALFNIDLNAANNAKVDLKSFLAYTNIVDLYKYFFDEDITSDGAFEYTDDYFNDKINFLYYEFFGDGTKVYDPTKRPDNPNGNRIVLSTLAIKVSQLYLYFFNQELKIKFGYQIIV